MVPELLQHEPGELRTLSTPVVCKRREHQAMHRMGVLVACMAGRALRREVTVLPEAEGACVP